jgi:hypothetical protein
MGLVVFCVTVNLTTTLNEYKFVGIIPDGLNILFWKNISLYFFLRVLRVSAVFLIDNFL